MWNKPYLLQAISELLFVVSGAALLFALVVWGARMPWFPLREVVLSAPLKEVQSKDVDDLLAAQLAGNFFSVNIESVRQAAEQIPWVRQAEIRRHWPGRIELQLEEHVPIAFWGNQESGKFINKEGEIFTAPWRESLSIKTLPILQGPDNGVHELVEFYQQATHILQAIHKKVRTITVSPRLAIRVQLDDGMIVDLGRRLPKVPATERLERFVMHYTDLQVTNRPRPTVVDMRYPNGFALQFSAIH